MAALPMAALRRYAPFTLLIATQMVLVLVAPSHGSPSGAGPLGGQFNGPSTASTAPGAPSQLGPSGVPTPGATVPGVSGVPGATQTTGPGTVNGTPPQGSSQQLATGRTTGRVWCITGLVEHPPCAPVWAGGNNGGATWQGVTATTIRVIMYRSKDNAAVDTILRGTGTYTPPAAEQKQLAVVQSWINKHMQLYGRKMQFIWVQGTCDIAPPVDKCFRADADQIVSKYHPFALFYDNDTAESAFFDELSRKGVVNWGGWNFTDNFSNGLRPYHYDAFMGGDQQAIITGTWYCRRLANKLARFAGPGTNVKMRKVAVVYPDSAMTTSSAKHLESIIRGCDRNGVVDSPYSSDTGTAASQARTDTATLKNEGVTSVIWFSDPIAPAYGTKAQASQSWFPEEIVAGSDLVDYDALAQTYDQTEWQHAFGPSDIGKIVNIMDTDAGRIWKAEGQSGSPNANSNLLTAYALLVMDGIIAAGPQLTPLSYEYGILNTPGYDQWDKWHNPQLEYIKFGRGDYTAISDIREVYWSNTTTSVTNGRPGAYIPLNGGQRYQVNDIPYGEPALPSSV